MSLFCVASLAQQSLTRIKGKIKASLRVPREAVRDALTETQREAKRSCVFLCKVSSVLKLSHFSRRLLCSYANCYGDEAVAPSYVRFTELLSSSFHCSVLRVLKIISSPRCPGYWTYQAMKMRNTSSQDGSATRPHESASFCR